MHKIIQWVAMPTVLLFAMAISAPTPADAADSRAVADKKHMKHKSGKMHRSVQTSPRKPGGSSAIAMPFPFGAKPPHKPAASSAGVYVEEVSSGRTGSPQTRGNPASHLTDEVHEVRAAPHKSGRSPASASDIEENTVRATPRKPEGSPAPIWVEFEEGDIRSPAQKK